MTREDIISRIEYDNARIDLYKRVMPHVLDIIEKYNGKQYGEKTKARMNAELKEKCNCHFYLANSWHEDISIIPLNEQGYSGTRFKYDAFNVYVNYPRRDQLRPLSDTNRICSGLTFNDFHLSNCHDYINDPAAHADNILASFENLKERYAEFYGCISTFNSMLPSNMERKRIDGFRNYL